MGGGNGREARANVAQARPRALRSSPLLCWAPRSAPRWAAAFDKAVRNSPRAGPVHWRVAGVLLLLLAGIPTALVVRSEVRREALNMPRAILSTGEIVRPLGESSRLPFRKQPLCEGQEVFQILRLRRMRFAGTVTLPACRSMTGHWKSPPAASAPIPSRRGLRLCS